PMLVIAPKDNLVRAFPGRGVVVIEPSVAVVDSLFIRQILRGRHQTIGADRTKQGHWTVRTKSGRAVVSPVGTGFPRVGQRIMIFGITLHAAPQPDPGCPTALPLSRSPWLCRVP